METPKEKAIKAAYGEYWDKVKDYVDENGWYSYFSLIASERREKLWQFGDTELEELNNLYKVRPKSLSGLENNNGWTRIESEEDLPKYNSAGDFYVMSNEGNKVLLNGGNAVRNAYRLKTITHWQLIETKPPIF